MVKPIDDGPHMSGKLYRDQHTGGVSLIRELDNPRPQCMPCSHEFARKANLPARCIAERVTLIRDTTTKSYRLIVHCHGASEIHELGPELPTNEAIAARVAFAGK